VLSRFTGEVAALYGWVLLGFYPDDPVPREAREALAMTLRCRPVGRYTPPLQAYVLVHDGQHFAALQCAAAALGRLPDRWWSVRGSLLCIQSAAHHGLEQHVEASRLRESDIALWPECHLLPWLYPQTGS
jgi:hypothetical protein